MLDHFEEFWVLKEKVQRTSARKCVVPYNNGVHSMIEVTENLSIDESELRIEFVQASGPGGQNVNKVASQVQLRFDIHSPSLPEEVRARLQKIAKNRISEAGDLLISAKRYRSQEQNKQDAIDRLVELIRKAAVPPKKRKPTGPTRASKEKRLETKRRRSEIKRIRRNMEDL